VCSESNKKNGEVGEYPQKVKIFFNKYNFFYYRLCTGASYDFHCKMCNNNKFFYCLCSAMEKHDISCSVIPRNCTWSCTVQELYFFYRLLRIRLKHQNPLLSYVQKREREIQYTANVRCSVQYTLLLLYLKLIMSVCNSSIKLYHIYACYTNITLCYA